jgi:hypothetical protein
MMEHLCSSCINRDIFPECLPDGDDVTFEENDEYRDAIVKCIKYDNGSGANED